MSDPSNPRRPKRNSYRPRPETLALLKSSGNSINGLGEAAPRRPSPFFWHPADQHFFGELQMVARQSSRKRPGSASAFQAAYDYPELLPVAELQNGSPAEQLAAAALHLRSPTRPMRSASPGMDPLYVFEGYQIDEPWVIVLALAHNYERLKEVPSDETSRFGAARRNFSSFARNNDRQAAKPRICEH
jgi:hypothetical protein